MCRTNGYPITLEQILDPQDRALRKAKTEERIEEYKKKLDMRPKGTNGSRLILYTRVKLLGNLAEQYMILGDAENTCKYLHWLIRDVRRDLHTMADLPADKIDLVMYWFRRAHVLLAPHEFPAFLKVMEWDFSEENKFFANRICVMGEWAKELEKLEFGEYDILGLSAPPRSGKSTWVEEPVKTPNGAIKTGDLKPGDFVIGSDGQPKEVKQIYPQGIIPTVTLRLADGRTVRCSLDHLWEVTTCGRTVVVDTRTLRELNEVYQEPVLVPSLVDGGKDWIALEKIEDAEPAECLCIRIDSGDHLYAMENGILTHNTGIGSLFLTWLMGRHSDKSMLFATHTGRMARKEFNDIYALITDPRRCWSEVFRGCVIDRSAEDLWIDISPKKSPNNYKTMYFT